MKTYYPHDNGARPFEVNIAGKIVNVHLRNKVKAGYQLKAKLTFSYEKIFIGKSPLIAMTKDSGASGKKFDGNTLLFELSNGKYIYIGSEIYTFSSICKIAKFISPVGNSDVPYPYAIDKENNKYLFIEYKILPDTIAVRKYKNPYDYYYEENKGKKLSHTILVKKQL